MNEQMAKRYDIQERAQEALRELNQLGDPLATLAMQQVAEYAIHLLWQAGAGKRLATIHRMVGNIGASAIEKLPATTVNEED